MKIILIIGVICIWMCCINSINYTVRTRILLKQLKDEFGEYYIIQFLDSVTYDLADSPKKVYIGLVDYIEFLKGNGEHQC